MMVARVLSDLQQAQASAERVLQLIEEKPDIEDSQEVIEKYGDLYNHKTENWENIEGKIEFKNVSFRYKNTNLNVLEDFNLDIKAGEMIALVGETGSGKSTIINLISRFYEPTEGTILIDGVNYQERSLSWLHHNLGYVLQTPQLFSGTIKENIMYGKLNATMEEVIAASKLANAHEFISKLENGYDTLVGEGGNKLSLGEKQLISFARAIIGDPRIIILDEATSALDNISEFQVQKAISTAIKGRTTFIVAHRLSTIRNADRIVVMEEGVAVEVGTYEELMAKKGKFYELKNLNDFNQKTAEEALA